MAVMKAAARERSGTVLCVAGIAAGYFGFALAVHAVTVNGVESGTQSFRVMGTLAEIIPGSAETNRASEYAGIARRVLGEIEADLSIYRPDSQLSRLNMAAGVDWIAVGPHLQKNLELSRRYGELTFGAFDVTAGPLVRLWGFSGGPIPTSLPSAEVIEATRSKVGFSRLRVGAGKAFLDGKGMAVDLGGIAKGYAVDICWEELRKQGARDFLVNLGGNIRASGSPGAGRNWTVGVRNPFRDGALFGKLDLTDGMGVSTSGNYERFVVIDGKRYAHIIDPRSGRPVEGMASVTVIAPTAVEADGIDTGLFVLGAERGRDVLRSMTNCGALFVPSDPSAAMIATPEFLRRFTTEPGTPRPLTR